MNKDRIEENGNAHARPEFPRVKTGIKAGGPDDTPEADFEGYEFWLSKR